MELFTRQAAVALFFGLFATSTQAKEYSYLETFDDDATFSAGGILPDGWLGDASAVPVQRYEGSYLGSGNYSGSYVLGTMASSSMGREAATTLVGETGKTVLSEWTQQTYTFTPEADGEYAFAINITSKLYNSGYVALDDFEVTGDEPGGSTVDPGDPDKVVCELPYSQSFDNENKDYDGTTYVPKGWLATGTSTFITANTDDLKAADGSYYLIAPESRVQRDDRIYTPYFHMQAGVEYTASFYLYNEGTLWHTQNL